MLRYQPDDNLTSTELTESIRKYGFFDNSVNKYGAFKNELVDNGDGTVTDRATGLMWQKAGSSRLLENREVKKYIKQLNEQRFAGYSDWRMPTVEELASLLVRERKDGAHIDSVFDNRQTQFWTIDSCDPQDAQLSGAWLVDFKEGTILEAWYLELQGVYRYHMKNDINRVKAVRSAK